MWLGALSPITLRQPVLGYVPLPEAQCSLLVSSSVPHSHIPQAEQQIDSVGNGVRHSANEFDFESVEFEIAGASS